MQTSDFDEYALAYDATVQQAISASGESLDFFNVQKARLTRTLAPQDTQRVLDFGCGVGNITRALAKEFPDASLFGADPSAESVAVARRRSNAALTFVQQPATELPFESASFDLAVAACVFHHIPSSERPRWMAELARVLRRGGRLVMFEHNPLNPLTQRVVRAVPFDANAELLRRQQAVELVHRHGFRVCRSSYYNFFPRLLSLLRPMEPHMGWIPMGAQFYVVGER